MLCRAGAGLKRPRDPSPYNLFIREEVKRLKRDEPGLDHREAFKRAAGNVGG